MSPPVRFSSRASISLPVRLLGATSGLMRAPLWIAALAAAFASASASAASAPKHKPLPAVPGTGRVVAVELRGEVDAGIAAFFQRVLAAMRDEETLFVEVDTLGGRLDAALAIRDALLNSKVTSICWVHPRA